MPDLTVREAHRRWSAGELAIVDCREAPEHEATRVEGIPLLPMSELLARVDELPTDRPLAVLCRSGARSAQVADYLTAAGGHGEVANVEGGIIAWAAEGLPYEGEPPR
ncbi:rhodanese-like domain-containing protein [Miltoncostaea marina]|uniref:rhodanese-like domain-containing protein n=1 Tax=Miltoncostaea marina TaxID=2843215 RepID=UPI001C3E2933|nr:rhodanese-like domain-containing protein [Miltoncostaea marina]